MDVLDRMNAGLSRRPPAGVADGPDPQRWRLRAGTGPANATITDTQRTMYSAWVQTSATEVTDFEIVRENRRQGGGPLDEAVFEHRVDSRYDGVGARVAYGHVLGLDAAARVIESNLPYATQYVSVGPQPDGIFQTANGPSPMAYTFSWWHNMQRPPGESWAGIRQSVHYDAETGLLRYVFGPHEGAGDAGPWRVDATTGP